MIQTNQMEIAFDFEAIAKNFTIFEAKQDQGDYWKSKVPDVALQECRALAVVYEWGPSCYILYHRASVEQYSLKQALECCEDNVRVQEITAQKLAETKKHLLAQLLCNALPGIQANGELYHNVTGKLYYMQPNWFYYRKEVLASFWTLQISFTKDCCVKLDVKTFSNVRIKQDSKNKPQYLFDPECYILRRALRDDPGKSTDHFVIGALNQRRRNTVPFLEFGSLTDYQNCKVGILHQFLRDVQTSLSPYLSLTIVSLDESTHLGVSGSVDSMTGIRNRLRETPLYLEDTVQDEHSRTLISMLRYELAQYSEVTLMEGTPEKGDALLRIIHYPPFYEEHPEDDEYSKAPKHCIVQHITVEDFQLTGMNGRGTKEKEDHKLLKVIQELAIKIDVNRRQMTCYDWSKLGFNKPITYLCHPRPHQRRGRQDPVRHPGPHQRQLHPGHLHPCDAGHAAGGQPHRGRLSGRSPGAGPETVAEKQAGRRCPPWVSGGKRARAPSASARTAAGRAGWSSATMRRACPGQRMSWPRRNGSARRS